MSPSAIPIETASHLAHAGMAKTVSKTAPSIVPSTSTSSTLPELDASRLQFTQNPEPRSVPAPNSPEVWSQSECTDHMITCKWTLEGGWDAPHLKPYGPFTIMPTASVLHYATECFEGMKLYRGYDGKLRLFRPSRNCNRMLTSATRIALPAFDPRELEKLIIALVAQDGAKWLPSSRPGTFLYLRPTMIATAAALGVQKPKEATLFVIAALFPSFDEPAGTIAADPNLAASLPPKFNKSGLRLLASSESTIRAWPGGFGFAKVGANYGPSLIAQAEARERGYDQILWLFGPDAEVTEAGASNFFVVWKTKEGKTQLVTAPLGDKIILDGVTRRSVLELARERLTGDAGLEVVERKFSMHELADAVNEGRLIEAFAAGTAFFIAPISEIHFRGTDLDVPLADGTSGYYAKILKSWLKGIMYGKEKHEWAVVVNEVER